MHADCPTADDCHHLSLSALPSPFKGSDRWVRNESNDITGCRHRWQVQSCVAWWTCMHVWTHYQISPGNGPIYVKTEILWTMNTRWMSAIQQWIDTGRVSSWYESRVPMCCCSMYICIKCMKSNYRQSHDYHMTGTWPGHSCSCTCICIYLTFI